MHTIILVDESPLFHFNLRQPILPQFVGKFVGNEFICLNTLNITDAYIKVWQRATLPDKTAKNFDQNAYS